MLVLEGKVSWNVEVWGSCNRQEDLAASGQGVQCHGESLPKIKTSDHLILARTIHLDTLEPYLTDLKLVKRGERIPIGLWTNGP